MPRQTLHVEPDTTLTQPRDSEGHGEGPLARSLPREEVQQAATIEVEREADGILYYVTVSISLSEEEIDARVAEDVPEYEITGYERHTGQAIRELTGALAFTAGDEIDLDDREERRARMQRRAEGQGPAAEGEENRPYATMPLVNAANVLSHVARTDSEGPGAGGFSIGDFRFSNGLPQRGSPRTQASSALVAQPVGKLTFCEPGLGRVAPCVAAATAPTGTPTSAPRQDPHPTPDSHSETPATPRP